MSGLILIRLLPVNQKLKSYNKYVPNCGSILTELRLFLKSTNNKISDHFWTYRQGNVTDTEKPLTIVANRKENDCRK